MPSRSASNRVDVGSRADVRGSAVHPLLVAISKGAFYLPEHVAPEQTHLILELSNARLFRVVGIAKCPDGTYVLGPHRRGIDEKLHAATALARPLSGPTAVSRVRGAMHGSRPVFADAPSHIATRRTDRIEQLPLTRLGARCAIDGRESKFIDGYRRLTRERPHGATGLSNRVTRACAPAPRDENTEEQELLQSVHCAADATRWSGKPIAARCSSHASATPLAIVRTRPMKRCRSVTPMAPRASRTLNACAPLTTKS